MRNAIDTIILLVLFYTFCFFGMTGEISEAAWSLIILVTYGFWIEYRDWSNENPD